MKATLEFNLPEDQDDFELATKGSKWYTVAWDMDQWLRGQLKFPENMNLSDDGYEVLEKCREQLREIINTYGVSLDDVS